MFPELQSGWNMIDGLEKLQETHFTHTLNYWLLYINLFKDYLLSVFWKKFVFEYFSMLT